MTDKITLYVGGRKYEGWENVSVSRSVEAVAGSFDLTATDKWYLDTERWQIMPGDLCELQANDLTLITGYVDCIAPSIGKDAHQISITGRDKTADLVDCSAVVASYEIRGQKLKTIAEMLCKPFGITVRAESDTGEAFPSVAIQPGETVWSCIDRLARQRKVAVTTDGSGNLVFAAIGAGTAHDVLTEGGNILSADAVYDFAGRYSQYIVKGQLQATGDSQDGWNAPQHAVQGKASDMNVKRYRPLVITAESGVYESSATTRAEQEAKRRAGDSSQINVTVQGWTQSNGEIWPLNAMARLKCPSLYVEDKFVIASVTYGIGNDGTTTTMVLKRPDAYIEVDTRKKESSKTVTVQDDWWSEYEE